MKWSFKKTCLIVLILLGGTCYAHDWEAKGKLIWIEPTYSDRLNIRIDLAAGNCPANSWLFFYGYGSTSQEKKESVRSVYAGLLASMYAGKNIVCMG